jgi:hypothetical protein
MSWAVFWNFLGKLPSRVIIFRTHYLSGSGLLSLLVPKVIEWSHSGLLYVFALVSPVYVFYLPSAYWLTTIQRLEFHSFHPGKYLSFLYKVM